VQNEQRGARTDQAKSYEVTYLTRHTIRSTTKRMLAKTIEGLVPDARGEEGAANDLDEEEGELHGGEDEECGEEW